MGRWAAAVAAAGLAVLLAIGVGRVASKRAQLEHENSRLRREVWRERDLRQAAQAALHRLLGTEARVASAASVEPAQVAPTVSTPPARHDDGAAKQPAFRAPGNAGGVLEARPRGGLSNQRESIINMAIAAQQLKLALLLPDSYPTFHEGQDQWLHNNTQRAAKYRQGSACGGLRRGHFGCLWDEKSFVDGMRTVGVTVLRQSELAALKLQRSPLPAADGVGGFWGCPESERKDGSAVCFKKTLSMWSDAVRKGGRRHYVAGLVGWNVFVSRYVPAAEKQWGKVARVAALSLRPAQDIATLSRRIVDFITSGLSVRNKERWWGVHLHDQITCRGIDDPVALVINDTVKVLGETGRSSAQGAGVIYVVSKHSPPNRLRKLAEPLGLTVLSKFDAQSIFPADPERLYPPEVCAAVNFGVALLVPQLHLGYEVSSFHRFVMYYRERAGRRTAALRVDDYSLCGHLPKDRYERWPNWLHLPPPKRAAK
eukprot:TRINITY_DN10857_c0_g1_i2.p1 TRINITY_DN10857_c0_g1~~TRINITY_DN10857_c0_g1_i2.p1  ORF type:complete len:484 (+),score=61.30 TRINITY_DN10857_c0_g1_i2:51-1502(+)